MPRPFFLSWEDQRNRWVYLLYSLLLNGLLTFLPLPVDLRWMLTVAGLGIPAYWVFRHAQPKPGIQPVYSAEKGLPLPPLLLFLGLALAVFLRFYKLGTLFDWPTGDESWNGTLALALSRRWQWVFFCTTGQAPPLPVWASALFFKLGFPPGLSLWLPSALASVLTVVMVYLAVRRFLSPSLAAVSGGLAAFGFWPIYVGRFAHQGIWLPLWACGCLYLLGRLLQASPASRGREAFFLGLAAGLGSFTFTPWPVLVLPVAVAAFRKDRKGFLPFLAAMLAGMAPFLAAAAREGYGHHISSEAVWNSHFSWIKQLGVIGDYFAVLFWGGVPPGSAYAPASGGFLNPLLSSFFWMGCLELVFFRRQALARWVGAAFLALTLPGFLTTYVETFRIAQVLPLLILITAVGFYSLLLSLPRAIRVPLFLILLLASSLFDLDRLVEPYRNLNRHHPAFAHGKSLEKFRAYTVLSRKARKDGPGLIFTDFDSPIFVDFDDSSLSLMTDPFNAALNPALDPAQAAWAAVYINVHYQPFLDERFPGFQWYWVTGDLHPPEGGEVLGVIALDGQNRPVLERWVGAHRALHQVEVGRFFRSDGDLTGVLQDLGQDHVLMEGDPFLESCYWEKRAAYEYRAGNLPEQLASFQMGLSKGYDAGHLWHNVAELMAIEGRYSEAREAVDRESKAPLGFPSEQILRNGCDFTIPNP